MVDIEYEITNEEFVPVSKAKDILDKIEEKTYEQKLAFEHAKKFSKIKTADANKLVKELESLDMRRLKPEQIIKIVDMMPADMDDIKVMFLHADVPFTEEELQKILEIVKKYGKG